jgi:hypothetical protein
VQPFGIHGECYDRRLARGPDDFQGGQCLVRPAKRFADDEVGTGIDRPTNLFFEHGPCRILGLPVIGLPDIRIADVAGQQGAALPGDLLCNFQRVAVERLQQVFLSDHAHLFPMGVIGEGLDDIGARVHELTMKFVYLFRMLEDNLRNVRPGLDVAPALELEQVSLRADDRTFAQALQQSLVPGFFRIHRRANLG